MSILDDLIAQLHALVEKVNETAAGVEGTKSDAESTVDAFEAVGAEGKAADASAMAESYENILATILATVPTFEAVMAQAEGLKTGGNAGSPPVVVVDSAGEFTLSGEVPRGEWHNEVGDKLEDPGESDAAADDVNMSKLRRTGRGFVRNANRAHARGKDAGDTAGYLVQNSYNPLQGAQAHTTVDTRPPPSASSPVSSDINMGDAIGSTIIVAAVVVEGAGRFLDRLRQRKKERGDSDGT